MLSDSDVKKVHWKIRQIKFMPYFFAGLGGAAMFALDTQYLKRAVCFKRIGVFAAAGYVYGLNNGYSFAGVRKGNFESDPDIIKAFESKYVNFSLNAAGYGNNALNMSSHTKEAMAAYKKPY